MKGILRILMVIAVIYPPGAHARRIAVSTPTASAQKITSTEDLADALEQLTPFTADVRFEVAMPMATDDVVYNLRLSSVSEPADTLAYMRYLINWQLPREETVAEGFLAYFDGHHYRYRDNRLQEYHFLWDSVPFLTGRGGVQRNGQFVDLLPRSIASELRAMLTDSTFAVTFIPDTTVNGQHVALVTATQNAGGFTGRNYRLAVDPATGLPLSVSNEYNPGQVSEQGVEVTYSYGNEESPLPPSSESELIAIYPEAFEKFRESNYRIENLRGLDLPPFSLPTLTSERYTRHKGDPFKAPVILAIIDPEVESAAATVAALRKSVAALPCQTDLIMAFMGSDIDRIESVAGTAAMGETMLISAKSLARDCGTSVYPTILVVGRDGKVENVILGFNNSLTDDVIQSIAIMN
ncbi:MAG: hypothetical protein K2H14_04175 [Muribaculaceae bacterium]|nr:hypothetical protein [Muribaculaceae bacterium]